MSQMSGEMSSLGASISGEMKPEDIPLAPGVDLAALKSGDQDPMEVVVEVPAGRSKRGWNYLPSSLQAIVKHVQEKTLSGFLGHQKPDEIDNKFEPPVTHWVGAKWQDGKAYFRGVIDAAAKDLKRWIRAGRVKQVSIFGFPKLQQVAGETQVVDYRPLSIDWTPLDRAGMPTRIVAIGEMDEILTGGGHEPMNWKELIAKLKAMLASKEVTLGQVVGEMGWNVQELAGEIDANWLKEVTGAVETLNKVREVLGVSGEMDIVKVAEEAAKAVTEQRKVSHEKLVSEVIKEKVSGEMAQNLVRRMLHIQEGATKEQIAGEIDALLKDESIKEAISKLHIDKPASVSSTSGSGNGNTLQNLRVKRNSI
ncbi:MAG: transcriptional regulator [Thermoanaerobacteraceae bacterium]|nr:transcriptional regulator [Thermoanaerobacteraceae bacterium]